ncbi:MAG: FGGY family carbohydrate kinase [Chloroflexota bacterium]|nr:FGGY family carbohydrate kinase [Chloroflexota bacterium]
MNVLAIDQGTSSTKALVVGEGRAILGSAEVAVHPTVLPDGGIEQDPEELWRSVVDAARMALDSSGVSADAVGLANQGETVLAWDHESGAPLSTAMSWQDRRAIYVTNRLRGRAEELRGLTGLPMDPYFAAPKMTRMRECTTREGVVTTTDAWLIHRLTGAFATDIATASRTLLLDLDTGTWSSTALEAFDLAREALPAIVPSAGVVGETSAFGPVLPLAGVIVDQQAALFGEACHAPGDSKCTFGTGAFLLANAGGSARRSRSGLAACVAWRVGDVTTYCLDGQVYTAGAAVTWLRDIGLLAGPGDLDTFASRVPHAGDVVFVPGLAGLAAPFWQPGARGAFVGLSLGTSKHHLVRSVVDGIAASVAWVAKAAGNDLGSPLTRLRVDGGLTRSTALMQAEADLLQVPVEVYPTAHATALGVAALTRYGMGDVAGAIELATAWTPSATYEPVISADEAAGRLDRWRSAALATIEFVRRES